MSIGYIEILLYFYTIFIDLSFLLCYIKDS